MDSLSVLVDVLDVSNSKVFGLDLILHELNSDTWLYLSENYFNEYTLRNRDKYFINDR